MQSSVDLLLGTWQSKRALAPEHWTVVPGWNFNVAASAPDKLIRRFTLRRAELRFAGWKSTHSYRIAYAGDEVLQLMHGPKSKSQLESLRIPVPGILWVTCGKGIAEFVRIE